MPDLNTHIESTALAAGGVISTFFTLLFDINPDALLVAFIGCWIGIAARAAVPATESHRTAIVRFLWTLGVVVICTMATAWLIPIALKFFPDMAQKSVAAVIGFCVVKWQSEIFDHASKAIGRLFGRIA